MSVLAKGMEMPKSCSDCFLDYDSIVCMALNKEFPDRSSDDGFYAYCSGRMPDCPLVEVSSEDVQPVKHGRWIEYPECLQYENAFSSDHIVCSRCKAVFNVLDNCTECFVCCPNCGAVMDGGDF